MKIKKLYLSRKLNGLCQLTALLPEHSPIWGTNSEDVYVKYGDPITLQNLCPFSVKNLIGRELSIGEVIRVKVSVEEIKTEDKA